MMRAMTTPTIIQARLAEAVQQAGVTDLLGILQQPMDCIGAADLLRLADECGLSHAELFGETASSFFGHD